MSSTGVALIEGWFAEQGWRPFAFQREAWEAYAAGRSGLVHAPTGMGKTYAVWMGLVAEWLGQQSSDGAERKPGRGKNRTQRRMESAPCRAVWLTPMRALANDLVKSLEAPIEAFSLPWSLEMRTGDTSSSVRAKQKERLPTALVTTPESLTLLLTYADAREKFAGLQCVVVDEWHELLGTKRGVQTELALARLRAWRPEMRVWGLSATLANLEQAAEVLLGIAPTAATKGRKGRGSNSRSKTTQPVEKQGLTAPVLIAGEDAKSIEIETVLPESIERFPWSGHLGVRLLPKVIEALERARTTLVFTNTRSQCEIWFRELLKARPDWAAEIAVHHGSLDRKLRSYVESRLREGTIRCVVCTSSLDLGVDFSPVDQVIQIGSPKGIARLLQRAGRSGHQPGATSRVVCVPTHALELVEFAAARTAAAGRKLEGREPIHCPLDVLTQHLVSMALAGGFVEEELLAEVRTTHAFRNLTREQWQWALDFVIRGGQSLQAYPQYLRVRPEGGRFVPANAAVPRQHRLAIGTIAGDNAMQVKFLSGKTLGTIEESFIARLRPRDRFVFAGRTLEFVRTKEMTAYVRKTDKLSGVVPRWDGGRFPLSTQMAAAVREKVAAASGGTFDEPEMRAAEPLLDLQQAWSTLPKHDQLLIERSQVREGHQVFLYPFEGRSVHEGLASLIAHRVARETACSISITPNDYGVELLSSVPIERDEAGWRRLLSAENLVEDLQECLNAGELARRQFRDIARVAGLVVPGYPGQPKSARQVQASSSLIYDVFREYDPGNLLLLQARREVLDQQLEVGRMSAALDRMARCEIVLRFTPRLTPLAFPLWAARIQTTHLSSERWTDRIARMLATLETAAGEK